MTHTKFDWPLFILRLASLGFFIGFVSIAAKTAPEWAIHLFMAGLLAIGISHNWRKNVH